MEEVKYLSDSDFEDSKLIFENYSIVECFYGSSGMLQIMEPVFSKLCQTHQLVFSHFRINTEDYPFILERFYVSQIPSYLFFYRGELIDRMDGLVAFNKLYTKVKQHLKYNKHL